MPITAQERGVHRRWLMELTQIPTVAGKEGRVASWIRAWAAERPGLELTEDAAGNLHVKRSGPVTVGSPVYFTAHMDHPAFTVERIIGPGTVQVGFRGGVMEEYFNSARITVHADGARVGATLTGRVEGTDAGGPFPAYLAELDSEDEDRVCVGDIATWELPAATIDGDLLYTHACDDLAALAAAVSAYNVLLHQWQVDDGPHPDVRLLFTRAEEIGFIGAIAACKQGTMPMNARVIALENSRSFDDSPIGGGPIVRVGDRLSVFSPSLTGAIARRAEELSGASAQPTATQKQATPTWRWQRKLMAGGACEATVFCSYGYEATCLCLPLGNYHNMGDLTAVQAKTHASPPRVAPEFISVSDFDGLVDLLVGCGQKLEAAPSTRERIEKLWNEKGFVLGEKPA